MHASMIFCAIIASLQMATAAKLHGNPALNQHRYSNSTQTLVSLRSRGEQKTEGLVLDTKISDDRPPLQLLLRFLVVQLLVLVRSKGAVNVMRHIACVALGPMVALLIATKNVPRSQMQPFEGTMHPSITSGQILIRTWFLL